MTYLMQLVFIIKVNAPVFNKSSMSIGAYFGGFECNLDLE